MGNTCCTPGAEDAEANGMANGAAGAAKQQNNSMSKTAETRSVPATAAPPAAKAKAALAGAVQQPLSPAGGSRAAGALDFQMVLLDLDQAEQLAYGTAFAAFGSGAESGSVQLDCQPLRDFVATNSACPYEELDVELLRRVGQDGEMKITLAAFIQMLRDNAVAEGKVLERFLGLSSNVETIDSQECRSGLLMFKDELGGPDSVGEGRWEQVFDMEMSDAGAVVSMEAWTGYCKTVARIARVVHVAKA